MLLFRRGQRVAAAEGIPRRQYSCLSAADEELLSKQIAKMRKPVDNAMSIRGGSATNRFLLALPPEQIQERLFQIISTYNLVYALILSGLIGVVCAPLDPTEYGADVGNVVIAYNALMYIYICVSFMLSANGVLHTSWALTQIASLTPETAFRFVIRGDLLWVQEALSLFTMAFVMAACAYPRAAPCSLSLFRLRVPC